MSKMIKATEEAINKLREEFEKLISSGKFSDGKVSFNTTLGTVDSKATIYFTELAWLKMQTLIEKFNTEVGWHGIARRGDNEELNEYFIDDILVYPQKVTGATVTTDQEEYETWLMSHDDETFNNIRMQGHSHVNMGVTPSSTDDLLYSRILQQLDSSMFYIFMIWNKSNSKTIKIYDMAKNTLFDTSDVTVKVLDDGTGIEEFLKNARKMVSTATTNYYSGYGSVYSVPAKTSTQSKTTSSVKSESKKEKEKETKPNKKYQRKQSQYDAYSWERRYYGG